MHRHSVPVSVVASTSPAGLAIGFVILFGPVVAITVIGTRMRLRRLHAEGYRNTAYSRSDLVKALALTLVGCAGIVLLATAPEWLPSAVVMPTVCLVGVGIVAAMSKLMPKGQPTNDAPLLIRDRATAHRAATVSILVGLAFALLRGRPAWIVLGLVVAVMFVVTQRRWERGSFDPE
jgi:hypothetical protein